MGDDLTDDSSASNSSTVIELAVTRYYFDSYRNVKEAVPALRLEEEAASELQNLAGCGVPPGRFHGAPPTST